MAERQKIKSKYDQAEFIAIMSAGSIDTAVLEQEITYCWFSIRREIFFSFHVYWRKMGHSMRDVILFPAYLSLWRLPWVHGRARIYGGEQ